ncbi:N-succinylarginine dihydrolase [Legionella fairfieldensis]|uniref:N-succinylarginine dihydrolase n=1 Tax=Legionella fairfieldensis TaxID=45064 RepID=UPI0004921E17|nr:N-succinylarginine dihydrolase [Legionella fairfieldensis]
MQVYELNLDGLVGPTHHYAGLAEGNLASTSNALNISNPQAAAQQGLAKMRLLHQMGLKQALLPPHQRPNLELLYQLGFTGMPAQQVSKAMRSAPQILSACYSASSMWAANAATVSASADTADNHVHFTAANLVSHLHRHQEADFSKILLNCLFPDPAYFTHHPVLPKSLMTGDEGAANHNRLCVNHQETALNLFVYGKQTMGKKSRKGPLKYPARQALEASQTIARTHQLNPDRILFACQNPKVIDQGVFHNDVIAVANESLLLIHEEAFLQQAKILDELREKANFPLQIIEVKSKEISVADAVNSYLFNSQLLTLPSTNESLNMTLIAPIECKDNPIIRAFIEELLADQANPVSMVHYVNLKQSMQNGGGPACLRLRIPLTDQELKAMHQPVLISDHLLTQLENWINRFYRDRLSMNDLGDPRLIEECFTALDELAQLLQLGSIYPFQRENNGDK